MSYATPVVKDLTYFYKPFAYYVFRRAEDGEWHLLQRICEKLHVDLGTAKRYVGIVEKKMLANAVAEYRTVEGKEQFRFVFKEVDGE
jgi:hypothetical protein